MLPFYGTAVFCNDDIQTRNLKRLWHGNSITYGLSAHSYVRGHIVDQTHTQSIFNVSDKDNGLLGTVRIPQPGSHNVLNALGAIAVCHYVLCIPFDRIRKSLERFRGVLRRFTPVGSCKKAAVFDDCAQHPTQLDTTLLTARLHKHKQLHVIFQLPHITQSHPKWDQFISVFLKHETHIYSLHVIPLAEQDEDEKTINLAALFASELSDKTKKMALFCYQKFDEVAQSIESMVSSHHIVITIGSDGASKIAHNLTQQKESS